MNRHNLPSFIFFLIGTGLAYGQGTVSGTQYHIGQFTTPAGTTIGNTNSYTDTTGDNLTVPGTLTGKTFSGTPDATLNQANPATPTCDGIFNSLQNAGNVVTVNQGYNCTEGQISSSGYRDLFLSSRASPNFARDTKFLDYRFGSMGTFSNEPSPLGYGNIFDYFLNSHTAQNAGSGGTWQLHQTNQVQIGSGKNQQNQETPGSGEPDNLSMFVENQLLLTRGISEGRTVNAIKGQGDYQGLQMLITPHGDDPDGSGEGKTNYRNQNVQDGQVWLGPASATTAAGATTLKISGYTGNPPFPYDGDYLVDSTKATAPFYITGATNFSGTTPGTVTVSTTLTPDNWGVQSADMARLPPPGTVPQQYNGATTPVTVTVTGLTSEPALNSVMCVGDQFNNEQVVITNRASYLGGTFTFTAGFRYWHPAGAIYSQGLQACHFLDIMANGLGNFRNVVEVLGAKDAHTLMLSAHLFGGWASEPAGIWSTGGLAGAGTVLTRDASGNVSTSFSGPGAGSNGQQIVINSASGLPSNVYGTWTINEVDNSGTVTWSFATGVTGAAGNFTATGPVYFSHNGIELAAGRLMPGAEIVYAGNPNPNPAMPGSLTLDGTVQVENNTMTVAANDQLESQAGPEVVQNLDHSQIGSLTPTSAQSPSIGHLEGIIQRPNDGYTWRVVQDNTEANYFQQDGGVHGGMNYEKIEGNHYQNFWTLDQPIATQGGAVFNITACPGLTSTQCSNTHNYGWNWLNVANGALNAYHQENYVNWTGTWLQQDSSTNGYLHDSRWTEYDANNVAGAGWKMEINDTLNGYHTYIGADHVSGAYLYDNSGASVAVKSGNVTQSAGSGPAVALTPTAFTYGGSAICTVSSGCGVSGAATAAAGTGVTSVICATTACTDLRGTYTIVGGTATTGTIATLSWGATATAYACIVTQNGGTAFYGIGHSIATTTGMTVTAGASVAGSTFAIDYQCLP